MTQHDDRVRLVHMLESAVEAEEMALGQQREGLDSNRMLQLALTRLLEIVGEAATRVSRTAREKYPQVPWSQIVALRNRLIHGYAAVDLDILWDIIQHDLPPPIKALRVHPEGACSQCREDAQ